MRREGAENLPHFDLSYINETLMTEFLFFCSQTFLSADFLPREP